MNVAVDAMLANLNASAMMKTATKIRLWYKDGSTGALPTWPLVFCRDDQLSGPVAAERCGSDRWQTARQSVRCG
jgi:hypothetical protein